MKINASDNGSLATIIQQAQQALEESKMATAKDDKETIAAQTTLHAANDQFSSKQAGKAAPNHVASQHLPASAAAEPKPAPGPAGGFEVGMNPVSRELMQRMYFRQLRQLWKLQLPLVMNKK